MVWIFFQGNCRRNLYFRHVQGNRPRNPLETAVWWAEHVIKTGGAPLARSHSIDLPWYIYHSLDVIATLLLGLLIFLSGWIWFIRRLLFGFTSKTQVPTQKIKQN
uniref:Uncharacterized protein n=1 Tax=Phlebotomus papatasi TaxID=29031 RepID=A0A1B0D5B2_PHLPP